MESGELQTVSVVVFGNSQFYYTKNKTIRQD